MKAIFAIIIAAVFCNIGMTEDVRVKSVAIPITDGEPPSEKGPKVRECNYFISEDVVSKLPVAVVSSGEGILPVHRAIAAAFPHFAGAGISESDYFKMAAATFEKSDDYTYSKVSDGLRNAPQPFRQLWFYSVTCEWPNTRKYKDPSTPILVLMDGSIVIPRERVKYMFEK
jgi:hypothetical protein